MYKITVQSKAVFAGAKNSIDTKKDKNEAIELFKRKCNWVGAEPSDTSFLEIEPVVVESDDYIITICFEEPQAPAEPATVVYISGPITGIEDQNRHLFKHAQLYYEKEGFKVVNPHELNAHVSGDPHETWRECMRNCIAAMMELRPSDVVVLLPNWEQSRGAKFERSLAEVLGVRCVDFQMNSETII